MLTAAPFEGEGEAEVEGLVEAALELAEVGLVEDEAPGAGVEEAAAPPRGAVD